MPTCRPLPLLCPWSRSPRWLWVYAIFIGLLALCPLPLPAETAGPTQTGNQPLEQQYQQAAAYFTQLEQDATLGKDRANWLKGTSTFHQIYLAQKKASLGAPSLYQEARMNRRMFDLFKLSVDLTSAIEQFTQVATLYPASSLADDALFAAAEAAQLDRATAHQANDLYRKIIEVYPQGDQHPKALARLQPLAEKPAAPAAPTPEGRRESKDLIRMAPVKYWSSTGYTRIVIETAAPVSYNANLLAAVAARSQRLNIDLANCYLPPALRQPISLSEGLLQTITPGQFNNDTVRVALDLSALTNYKIFSLNDPFRLVIDIQGNPPATAAKPAAPPTPTVAHITPAPALAVPQTAGPTGLAPGAKKLVNLARSGPSDKEMDASLDGIISLVEQKKRSPKVATVSQAAVSKASGKEKISLAQQLGLGVRKIVIDPGHGGKDPGAMAFGLKEKDIVLKVSQKIAKILKTSYHYEVALTRIKDVYIPLEKRTALANRQNSDLFLSIHVNAHPDKTIGGIETYFLNLATNADAMRVAALENATSTHNINELQDILASLMKNSKIDESSRLAQFVQTNLIAGVEQRYKTRNLGVKQAPFYVLIGAEMPAILAEISFITNPEEAKLLQDEHYLDKLAQQIAAGVAAYVDHHHTAAMRF